MTAFAEKWNSLDRRIWEEELEEFVPRQVFDIHTHIYSVSQNITSPDPQSTYRDSLGEYAEASWNALDQADGVLMPGRQVDRLAFPFPFAEGCDFAQSNDYIAGEVAGHPHSGALMLVHPGMSAADLEQCVDRHGFLGFKPYRFFSSTGDAVHCRITDFLPEHQIEVADRRGLLIMMHVSKPDAIADPENIEDMVRLSARYPNARWILAHCARSYSAWAIEKAGPFLRDLPNVWYDTSSVCESDAIDALYTAVGPGRVMYGSDDIPVGVLRGKYVSFGRGWAYLSEKNQSLNLSHCDGRMTFTRYEQLRAMRQAARRVGLSEQQNREVFHDTAAALVKSVRESLSLVKSQS